MLFPIRMAPPDLPPNPQSNSATAPLAKTTVVATASSPTTHPPQPNRILQTQPEFRSGEAAMAMLRAAIDASQL